MLTGNTWTETTAWALAVITYRLLSKPALLARLTVELDTVINDPRQLPMWTVLEKLPFLSAVIMVRSCPFHLSQLARMHSTDLILVLQDRFRLTYGVSGRTARIPTEEDLIYPGEWNKKPIRYSVPRGFAIGMSSVLVHHNEEVFPQSNEFQPDRWLRADAQTRKAMDGAMLNFSKGSRACLGKQ